MSIFPMLANVSRRQTYYAKNTGCETHPGTHPDWDSSLSQGTHTFTCSLTPSTIQHNPSTQQNVWEETWEHCARPHRRCENIRDSKQTVTCMQQHSHTQKHAHRYMRCKCAHANLTLKINTTFISKVSHTHTHTHNVWRSFNQWFLSHQTFNLYVLNYIIKEFIKTLKTVQTRPESCTCFYNSQLL